MEAEQGEEMSLFQSCQEVSQADFRFLEACSAEKEGKEEITDVLLERLVMKGWQIYQNSGFLQRYSLSLVPGVSVLDPLDVSSLLPVPAFHVEKFDPLYSVDGWLFNISLHGLSSVYLDSVSVTRSPDLSTINILSQTRLEVATFQGLYNLTGRLGLMSIDTWGNRPWSADISNITHTLRISMKADNNCDQSSDIFLSYLDYQDTSLDMTGLDSTYNGFLEKIFRVLVSTANLSVQRVMRAWVTGLVQNILCS